MIEGNEAVRVHRKKGRGKKNERSRERKKEEKKRGFLNVGGQILNTVWYINVVVNVVMWHAIVICYVDDVVVVVVVLYPSVIALFKFFSFFLIS